MPSHERTYGPPRAEVPRPAVYASYGSVSDWASSDSETARHWAASSSARRSAERNRSRSTASIAWRLRSRHRCHCWQASGRRSTLCRQRTLRKLSRSSWGASTGSPSPCVRNASDDTEIKAARTARRGEPKNKSGRRPTSGNEEIRRRIYETRYLGWARRADGCSWEAWNRREKSQSWRRNHWFASERAQEGDEIIHL